MRWKINNKDIWFNDKKYRINWDKKSRSKPQFQIKQFLKPYWEKQIVFEELRLPKNLLYCDILNATIKVAIEYHGVGHFENGFNKFFHKTHSAYLRAIQRDAEKAKILEANGYQLIELYPDDLEKLSPKFFLEEFELYL